MPFIAPVVDAIGTVFWDCTGTFAMGPRTEDRKLPECSWHSSDRKRQVTILRDYVEVLRKERNRLEAKLLNEHIHQASVGGLHGSALEELQGRDPGGIHRPPKEGIATYP